MNEKYPSYNFLLKFLFPLAYVNTSYELYFPFITVNKFITEKRGNHLLISIHLKLLYVELY